MPLEIKILDYGDIELESSFLVLGRDCGRTRRVLTLGFLIVGGPYPVVVDTGYRSNQIMETLGMRGLQFHENMIENQLARHGVRMGDVRYVCHTHLHIDHAGKDDRPDRTGDADGDRPGHACPRGRSVRQRTGQRVLVKVTRRSVRDREAQRSRAGGRPEQCRSGSPAAGSHNNGA